MYVLILNPLAGRGAALNCFPKVEALLKDRGIEYRVVRAETPEMALEAARECESPLVEGVIVLGGDGTIFNVANGIEQSDVPLLFASCGTGNDFVRSLKLPGDPIEALRIQLDAPPRRIDVGRMNGIRFLNVSGTGFDVDVLRHAEKYKQKYRGLIPYLLGLLQAIRAYRPMTAMVSFDGEPEERCSFAILSVGNGRYFGGGMKAVPDANVADGLFDVVIVKPVAKLAIPPLLAFYIMGKHVSLGLGRMRRCRKLSIRCQNMTVNLDGELRSADVADYELLPSALTVRIPE